MSGMNGLLLLSILVSLAHLARARDAGGDRSHAFLEPRGSLYFDGASPDPRQTTYYESPAIEAVGLRGATVSAWVRVERHKRYNWVAGTANRDNGWALFVDEGEKACFGLFQNKQLKTISTRSLQIPKAWHYVTGVFDNGTIQVFVDAQPGEVVPLSHRSLSPDTWKGGILVGGTPDMPQLRLHGELSQVQVWDVARGAEAIARDMVAMADAAAPDGGGEGGMVAWWSAARAAAPHLTSQADEIPDLILGRNLILAGTGPEPIAKLSSAPTYLRAKAFGTAGGSKLGRFAATFGVKSESETHSIALEGLPSHLSADAFLADESGTNLGEVPAVPWPLVLGRTLRVVVDPQSSNLPQCAKVNFKFQLPLGHSRKSGAPHEQSLPVFLVVDDPDPTSGRPGDSDHSGIAEACHFSGHDLSMIKPKRRGLGSRGRADLAIFVMATEGDDLNRLAAAAGALTHGIAATVQCFVFQIAANAGEKIGNMGEFGAGGVDGAHSRAPCAGYTVPSAHAALKVAQSVGSGAERLVFARGGDLESTLPATFPEILERALHLAGNKTRAFTLFPDERGIAMASVCSPAGNLTTPGEGISGPASRADDLDIADVVDIGGDGDVGGEGDGSGPLSCERMDAVGFAKTIVSALGGAHHWWPVFLPNAFTFLDSALFRAVHLEHAGEGGDGSSGREVAEFRTTVTLWQTYVQILQYDDTWGHYQDTSIQGEGSHMHFPYTKALRSSESDRKGHQSSDDSPMVSVTDVILELQKVIA